MRLLDESTALPKNAGAVSKGRSSQVLLSQKTVNMLLVPQMSDLGKSLLLNL